MRCQGGVGFKSGPNHIILETVKIVPTAAQSKGLVIYLALDHLISRVF